MAGTQYQEVLGAISDYYGSGSDQWVNFAKYGIGYSDAESVLSQVPGVEIYKNNAGAITGYAYNAPFSNSSAGIAGEINSNLQVPAQANGTAFKGSIPANGTINSQSGNINFDSGAKATSSGATVTSVLSKVTTGIAAVATGAKLGAWIDSQIYKAAPDYWDETFPSINPQTWDTIAGKNKLGEFAINALFSIDKTNNRTQMYIPENAFAYLAYCMAQEGFFATGEGKEVTAYDDKWGATEYFSPPLYYKAAANVIIGPNNNNATETVIVSGNPDYMCNYSYVETGTPYAKTTPIYLGTSPFTIKSKQIRASNWTTGVTNTITINNIIYYYATVGTTFSYIDARGELATNIPQTRVREMAGVIRDFIKLIYGGTSRDLGGKEGVDKQTGAIYPTTTDWSDPEATRQNIRTQYPDLYNNSIYTDVPQPDGTTNRIIYYPVNMTSTTGSEEKNPTNTSVTYNNTYVDDSSTEDLLNTVLRYLYQTQSDTKQDTPNPPDTPNPTDTGTGNTPPVVAPTGQASSLFAVYNPTQAALNSFGAWLWSSNFIDQLLKLFNDPMQSIIGLHKIFASPSISGTANIRVGYLDSGVSANTVGNQYTTIDCGSVRVREESGNVFDYQDTDVRLYLPFIGIVPLDVMDVMRGTVSVIYHVDVITGACLAEVKVLRDSGGGTLYQFAGDAAVRYPISSGSYMGVVSGVLGVVGGIASGIMSGGATLPMAAGAIAGGVGNAKTTVQHSGSFAGNAGAMGAKKPYLIIERPQTAIADGYKPYQGRGANVVMTVGEMSGYFKMTDVRTDSVIGAAESEIEAIRAAIEQGVIA